MSHEFDFIDLYYLNDLNNSNPVSPELSLEEDVAAFKSAMNVIRISDGDDAEENVTFTYSKFLEILDNEGLEGLVNL